jgi:REP element-mobilizing transposase RayT
MVIGYHLIWTLYGWWLPNDPRGSTSERIRNDLISELGELHYGRKHVQPSSREIREFYLGAREKLRYPLLTFSPSDFHQVGGAFAETCKRHRYTCYACAVMPDHIHLLIRKHKHVAEEMIDNFQTDSRESLIRLGLRTCDHPTWGGPGWKVFLDHPDEIRRTIAYVEGNPTKARLRLQNWSFVAPYDDWPLRGRTTNRS